MGMPDLPQHRVCAFHQGLRHAGVCGKKCTAGQGNFILREKGRGIHVVLQQVSGHHHIAHLHAARQATGNAREQYALHAKTLEQNGGRAGSGHFANARQNGHHLMAMPMAQPKVSARHSFTMCIGHAGQHRGQLLLHGPHQSDVRHQFLSRSSRRKILPTAVLGSSVRNSTTLGCL